MKHVLLVEDEPLVARIVTRTVEQAGYLVTLATTGMQALTLAMSESYDCAIFDVSLPDLNGLDLVGFIRRQERPGGPRALIIVSSASDLDTETWTRAGADGFVPKPLTLSTLEGALAAAERRHRAAGASSGAVLGLVPPGTASGDR